MRYPESWYYPPGFDYRNDPNLNDSETFPYEEPDPFDDPFFNDDPEDI